MLWKEGADKDVLPLKAKTYEIIAHVRDMFVTQLWSQLTASCSSCRFSRLFREITKQKSNAFPFHTIMYCRDAFKFNSTEEISLHMHTLMIFKTTRQLPDAPNVTDMELLAVGKWQHYTTLFYVRMIGG